VPRPRQWLVPDWIPDRVATLLYGDGGTGKSLLALQLMVAAASGSPWLGLPVDKRRVFGLFCEDEEDEVHRRLVAVVDAAGLGFDALDALAWTSLVDQDGILAVPHPSKPASMLPTDAWSQLVATIKLHAARLVVLDTAADIFGGDEIRRPQVRAFMQMLSRLAREIDGAVLVTAHPSVDGLRSGTGTSGSTGWNAGSRSRLYLARPDNNGATVDPDERVLTKKKANFSSTGDAIKMRWANGVLVATSTPVGIDRMALNAHADRVFVELLRATYAMHTNVAPSESANNYAPTVFAKRPDRDGLEKADFVAAMHRLVRAGSVKVEEYGRPSERRSRLAPA
jgi:RecA-family ATPase